MAMDSGAHFQAPKSKFGLVLHWLPGLSSGKIFGARDCESIHNGFAENGLPPKLALLDGAR